MKIKIRRIDKDLPLPEYKTGGAAGFDFTARLAVTIAPKEIVRVPLNIALEFPKEYFLMVAPRGSLHKMGLMLANNVGIGDSDFSGNDDEYQAALYNFSDQSVTIDRGQRLVQGILIKRDDAEWHEVEELQNKNRGGFGSTGLV